ncbi:hypothetical protein ACFP3I_15430 [Chryseobacterium arachidis]|uniref:hypothetical protein n=1 Tax=Chryseobacterium arachidis TaxID=1416778 RepID=UPI00361C5BF1
MCKLEILTVILTQPGGMRTEFKEAQITFRDSLFHSEWQSFSLVKNVYIDYRLM